MSNLWAERLQQETPWGHVPSAKYYLSSVGTEPWTADDQKKTHYLKKNKKIICGPMNLNCCSNMQMVSSEFGTNNMNLWSQAAFSQQVKLAVAKGMW